MLQAETWISTLAPRLLLALLSELVLFLFCFLKSAQSIQWKDYGPFYWPPELWNFIASLNLISLHKVIFWFGFFFFDFSHVAVISISGGKFNCLLMFVALFARLSVRFLETTGLPMCIWRGGIICKLDGQTIFLEQTAVRISLFLCPSRTQTTQSSTIGPRVFFLHVFSHSCRQTSRVAFSVAKETWSYSEYLKWLNWIFRSSEDLSGSAMYLCLMTRRSWRMFRTWLLWEHQRVSLLTEEMISN